MIIRVGHPSYSGSNQARWHMKYALALADLLSRGVTMKDAHAAIRSALRGSSASCSKMYRGTRTSSIEVIATD